MNVVEKLIELQSVARLDLASLSRDRLENITKGLISGLSTIFEVMAEETEHKNLIAKQQQLIQKMAESVQISNSACLGTDYIDLLKALVESYPADKEVAVPGLYKAYRLLSKTGVQVSAQAAGFWDAWPATVRGEVEDAETV